MHLLLLVVFDYFTIVAVEYLSLFTRNWLFSQVSVYTPSYEFLLIFVPFVYLFLFYKHKLYTVSIQFWDAIRNVCKSCAYAAIVIIVTQYAAQQSGQMSRVFIVLLCVTSIIAVTAERYVAKRFLRRLKIARESIILIGEDASICDLLSNGESDLFANSSSVGVLCSKHCALKDTEKMKYLGDYSALSSAISSEKASSVLIVQKGMNKDDMTELILKAQPLVKTVALIPDLRDCPVGNVTAVSFYDERVVVLSLHNNLAVKRNLALKYAFDVTASIFGTLLISPILIVIALWIYKDSPGPIFFKHKRLGRGGKYFECYKFRSMCVNAQEKLKELLENDPKARAEWDKDFKLKDDPRITKSGAFLRKTSLDELPQILNVIRGEMSLVGPRPIVTDEIERYGKYIHDYYAVRPGITGLWQTSGRNDVDYKERVEMDSWYVRNWSVWTDIVILFRTLRVVVKGRGAY